MILCVFIIVMQIKKTIFQYECSALNILVMYYKKYFYNYDPDYNINKTKKEIFYFLVSLFTGEYKNSKTIVIEEPKKSEQIEKQKISCFYENENKDINQININNNCNNKNEKTEKNKKNEKNNKNENDEKSSLDILKNNNNKNNKKESNMVYKSLNSENKKITKILNSVKKEEIKLVEINKPIKSKNILKNFFNENIIENTLKFINSNSNNNNLLIETMEKLKYLKINYSSFKEITTKPIKEDHLIILYLIEKLKSEYNKEILVKLSKYKDFELNYVILKLSNNYKWLNLNLDVITTENLKYNYFEYFYITFFYILNYYICYNVKINTVSVINFISFVYVDNNNNLLNKIIDSISRLNNFIK